MSHNGSQNSQELGSQGLLRQLAEAAGLAVNWKNYRNQDRTVGTDTLRAILHALDIAADSDAQCRHSLEQLKQESAAQIPRLLVGRVGEKLCLPPALRHELQRDEQFTLIDDRGALTKVGVSNEGPDYCVELPRQPGYYYLQNQSRELALAVAPQRCTSVMDLTGKHRAWGVGAQLYSLRRNGDGGVGDFTALREFAVGVARAGADGVAVSPVHAQFAADRSRYSPYSPSSRLFINVLYIDPEQTFSPELVKSGLRQAHLEASHGQLEREALINWPEAARAKLTLLRHLWERKQAELMDKTSQLGRAFQQFREHAGEALELHAIFETLHAHHLANDSQAWHWRHWEPRFRDHGTRAVEKFAAENRHEILFHSFLQWLADRGLADAHAASREAGAAIGLIADLAVGTDSGGSHAWSRQEDMLTGLTIGAPPDMLNHQGQDWGLTSFSPRALTAHGYAPMREMLRASLRHAGGLRIDHILGLRRLWLIPEGAAAHEGAYLHFPQNDLLSLVALESWRHQAIIVGEDLGTIPGNFREQLATTGLLGMGVLWFEKDNGLFIDPSRWRSNAQATTTTHDLPTVAGWWQGRDL
ncbi:MAG: 4-alpha-glucanotransferase, partial [Cellvibrionaceae bacterium]